MESALAVFRPGVAKVHWPLCEVDGDGTPTGAVVPRRPLQEGDLLAALIADGPDAYLSPPTSANAWARDFLASVLPMSEAAFRQHADMYLATLAPVFGQIRAVPVPLGYRVQLTWRDLVTMSLFTKRDRLRVASTHTAWPNTKCRKAFH